MKCPICFSNETDIVFSSESSITSDRKFTTLPNESRVCKKCGCTFNAKGSRTNALKFYAETYNLHGENALSEFQVYAESNFKGQSDAILDFILNNIPLKDKGKLLEVGCGKGILISKFIKQKPKWSVHGVEPSAHASSYFQKALPSVKIFEGTLNDSPFTKETYDFVASSGVLEHVINPLSFLLDLKSRLSSDGFMYIGVPNFEIKPDDFLVFDHLTNFTSNTLDFLYKKAGLKLIARDKKSDRIWLWDALSIGVLEKDESINVISEI